MKTKEIRYSGDCLLGIGIPPVGIAVVDREAEPKVFDVVWCNNSLCGVNGYLKQIVQTGKQAIVRTQYIEKSRDYQFFAPEIYGVVLRVMDENRNVVWERPEKKRSLAEQLTAQITQWRDSTLGLERAVLDDVLKLIQDMGEGG